MEMIVNDNLVSFNDLQKKIYKCVCDLGVDMTRIILEAYDDDLAKGRDKKKYRDKGKRSTCIKTLYGDVGYSRRIYQTETDDGRKAFVYLLDEAMRMEKIGLISTTLAEEIAMTVTEAPYRVTADIISETCGQSISPMGVWNLIQKLGERIDEEERYSVNQMHTDGGAGRKAIPVLFEEMDGIWISMQDKRHKKAPKQEIKAFTMYEGWEAGNKRSTLVGKTTLAGMEDSATFHEKREALIRSRYDADEIGQRILNGDGGSWIKEDNDPDAIFQLDRYHIYQEILRKIKDDKARKDIRRLFEEEKIDELLAYIETYAVSVESPDEGDKKSRNARELLRYLTNNRDGLMAYDRRGIEIPAPPEGIEYRGMGVQENQNCTTITMRMKHRRMRWSPSGANNMAKALYRKENKDLIGTIDRYTDGLVFKAELLEIIKTLSATKAPKHDGKGSPYPDRINCHMPLKEAVMTASRKAFLEILGV